MLNFFDWFRPSSKGTRTATELYGSIVTQARLPVFYIDYGVSDVAEKRYELIVLHLVLVMERLRASQGGRNALGQELVEAFVRDLDGSIREMAIGDTKVPTNVKKAAGGLLDRDLLYRQAFEAEDQSGGQDAITKDDMTLGDLLSEFVFDGNQGPDVVALQRYVQAMRRALVDWPVDGVVGRPVFVRPEDYLTEV